MQRSDKDLPQDIKASKWVARHFKQVFIASVALSMASLFVLLIMVMRLGGTVAQLSQAINNLSTRVVVVRADGKVVQLETEKLSQSHVYHRIRDVIFNKVILSGMDFQAQNVTKFEDVIKIPKVADTLNYIIEKSEAEGGYRAYVDTLFRAYMADNLPEVVWVGDVGNIRENIAYDDGRFRYVARIPLTTRYVLFQRVNEGSGHMDIELEGFVDISKANPQNVVGLYFTKFLVKSYVAKTAN